MEGMSLGGELVLVSACSTVTPLITDGPEHTHTDQADVTDDENFYDVLASHVQISSIETSLNGHIHSRKTAPIAPQTLAAHWIISPERAK
jgi:hypothetical protein